MQYHLWQTKSYFGHCPVTDTAIYLSVSALLYFVPLVTIDNVEGNIYSFLHERSIFSPHIDINLFFIIRTNTSWSFIPIVHTTLAKLIEWIDDGYSHSRARRIHHHSEIPIVLWYQPFLLTQRSDPERLLHLVRDHIGQREKERHRWLIRGFKRLLKKEMTLHTKQKYPSRRDISRHKQKPTQQRFRHEYGSYINNILFHLLIRVTTIDRVLAPEPYRKKDDPIHGKTYCCQP